MLWKKVCKSIFHQYWWSYPPDPKTIATTAPENSMVASDESSFWGVFRPIVRGEVVVNFRESNGNLLNLSKVLRKNTQKKW